MWQPVSHEAIVFAVMAIGGVVFGVLFDVMRAVRCGFGAGKLITNITDALFITASGVAVVYLLIRFNDGILRMYEFAGIFLGGFLYFFTVSTFIRRIFDAIFKILSKFIQLIFKIVLTPTIFLYKILLGLFKRVSILLMKKRKRKDGKKEIEKDILSEGISA